MLPMATPADGLKPMLEALITSVCQYVGLDNVQKTRIDFDVVFITQFERNRLKSDTLFIAKNASQESVDRAVAEYLSPLNEALNTQ